MHGGLPCRRLWLRQSKSIRLIRRSPHATIALQIRRSQGLPKIPEAIPAPFLANVLSFQFPVPKMPIANAATAARASTALGEMESASQNKAYATATLRSLVSYLGKKS